MAAFYQIKIDGHLDLSWSDWFSGFSLRHLENNQTLIAGYLPDQSALHGLLERIRDLNLVLISVARVDSPSPMLNDEINNNQSS